MPIRRPISINMIIISSIIIIHTVSNICNNRYRMLVITFWWGKIVFLKTLVLTHIYSHSSIRFHGRLQTLKTMQSPYTCLSKNERDKYLTEAGGNRNLHSEWNKRNSAIKLRVRNENWVLWTEEHLGNVARLESSEGVPLTSVNWRTLENCQTAKRR